MKLSLVLWISVLALLLVLYVPSSSAGECCRAHWDMFNRYHVQRWCPIYCCGTSSSGLTCCSDYNIRTTPFLREDFCGAWFIAGHNVWIPILVGVVIIALLIGSCICCVRCCCIV